jgi:hypothetical protein
VFIFDSVSDFECEALKLKSSSYLVLLGKINCALKDDVAASKDTPKEKIVNAMSI